MTDDQDMRDLLNAVAGATTPPVGLADRLLEGIQTRPVAEPRPLRRWIAPLLAAAAVAALVFGGLAIAHRHGTQPAKPTPTPSPSFPGFTATSVYFADATHGWALGDNRCATSGRSDCATLLKSVDGGRHWSKLVLPSGIESTRNNSSCATNGDVSGPCVDHVVFADPSVGYLWSHHRFYMTTDSGQTWRDLNQSGVTRVVIVGGKAIRQKAIYACSSPCLYDLSAAAVGTNDWHSVTPGVTATNKAGNGTRLFVAHGKAYFSETFFTVHGANDISESPTGYSTYESVDGTTWQVMPFPSEVAAAFTDVGPTGIVVALAPLTQTGSIDAVSTSVDDGATFVRTGVLPTTTADDPEVDVTPLSPTRLVLSQDSADGATSLSTDGGTTWTVIDHVGASDRGFSAAQFVTASIGYRISATGLFVSVTHDGGATWQHLPF